MIKGFLGRKGNALLLFSAVVLFLILCVSNRAIIYTFFENSVFKQLLLLKVVVFSWMIIGIAIYLFTKKNLHIVIVYSVGMLATAILVFSKNNIFFDLGGDNWYMNALVTKHKSYFDLLIDSTTYNIPSYLSPLYFFLVGIFSKIFNLDSARSLLVFSFVGITGMPLLYYFLLKDRFQDQVTLIAIFIGCAFFHYELALKPYQSISALLALIFYYNFLTQVDEKTKISTLGSTVLLGIFIFFLYYYHFTYLAIAFFFQIVFDWVLGRNLNLKAVIKKFGIYFVIFLVALVFFIGPHVLAVLRVGSSHKIFFGSTNSLDFVFLSFPLALGFFDVVKKIDEEYSFKTFTLICSLSLLFVLNLFLELFAEYNIHVFKIQHIVFIILLPHAIRFVFDYLFKSTTQNLNPLAQKASIIILLFFSTNEWISYCFNYKKNSNQYRFWSEIAADTQNKIDLRGKVVFFTTYNSDLEYGALIPNFRFLPVNNDYGSPASQLTKRVAVMKRLDSLRGNPAGFANLLMNNGVEKIDFLIWNDGLNVLSWEEISKLGENVKQSSSPIEKGLLSTRYFEKIDNVNFLYRINYHNNFEAKPLDSLIFLEKVSKGLISSNHLDSLHDDLELRSNLYTPNDIKDIVFFFKKNLYATKDQLQNVVSYARPVLKNQSYEAEFLPSGVNSIQLSTYDPKASGRGCRKFVPNTSSQKSENVLIFGTYTLLPKGRYHTKILVKSNLEQDIRTLIVDGFSAETNSTFFRNEISSKEIFSVDGKYVVLDIEFEIPVNLLDFEIRFFVDPMGKADVSVDKIQIFESQ